LFGLGKHPEPASLIQDGLFFSPRSSVASTAQGEGHSLQLGWGGERAVLQAWHFTSLCLFLFVVLDGRWNNMIAFIIVS